MTCPQFVLHKVNNIVTNSIEKYEGYNSLSDNEINRNLESVGYNATNVSCKNSVKDAHDSDGMCYLAEKVGGKKEYPKGACIYYCEKNGEYYYYKIRTYMPINIPIINDILPLFVYSSTNEMYNFENR